MDGLNGRVALQQAAVISGISIAIEALAALQRAHLSLLRNEYAYAATAVEREYYEDAMQCASARVSALTDALRIVDSVLLPG